jgi:hypothetical protein
VSTFFFYGHNTKEVLKTLPVKNLVNKITGGIIIHIIGRFFEPGQVGGLIDTLKNSGVKRRDMIVSSYDYEKFEGMSNAADPTSPVVMSDQDDFGEMKSFVEGVKAMDVDSGIIVSVKTPRHKSQEVKNVMEQSGATEILIDD